MEPGSPHPHPGLPRPSLHPVRPGARKKAARNPTRAAISSAAAVRARVRRRGELAYDLAYLRRIFPKQEQKPVGFVSLVAGAIAQAIVHIVGALFMRRQDGPRCALRAQLNADPESVPRPVEPSVLHLELKYRPRSRACPFVRLSKDAPRQTGGAGAEIRGHGESALSLGYQPRQVRLTGNCSDLPSAVPETI